MAHRFNRRQFLQTLSAGALGASLYPIRARAATPVRVRGRVRVGGRPAEGVVVSDGRITAVTRPDGSYELVSAGDRPFVFVSPPSDAVLPIDQHGALRLFRPLTPAGRGGVAADFDLERRAVPATRHAFLVLADPQTQSLEETAMLHAETVPDVVETVAGFGDTPVFGVGCGDLMFDNLELFPEYQRAIGRMGVPFAQVVGNHDLDFSSPTDEGSTATFQWHFGPTYYSYNVGQVHYVVLDDVFWNGTNYFGYIDDVQLNWLAADLGVVKAGSTVVVFAHIPFVSSQYRRRGESSPSPGVSVSNRQAVLRLLEPFEAHIVAGHTHELEHARLDAAHQHVSGAVCGAWWSGPICADGTPNGYHVFEADGGVLRWRYKSTGLPADHQIRVYAKGSDPAAPDEIVANVWDHAAGWEVFWFEDGERKGSMGRRIGLDPDSVRLHAGPELPPRRPWVNPWQTEHLFFAPVSSGTRRVTVEALDPWGRRYASSLEL